MSGARSSRWTPVINAAGVIAGSWLAADTVNAVVSANLWAEALPEERRWADAPAERERLPVESYLEPIVARNVFANGAPDPDAGGVALPAGEAAVAGACTLPLTVLSVVVVTNDPSLSLVTLLDRAASPPVVDVRQVGEEAPGGARIAAVTLVDSADGLGEDAVVELVRADGAIERCASSETATAPGPGTHVPGLIAMASSADTTLSYAIR